MVENETEKATDGKKFPISANTGLILGFHVADPKVLISSAEFPSLRFTVTFTLEDGPMFSIPGWRIIQGRIQAPSRKAGKGWAQMIELQNAQFLETLDEMVQVWVVEEEFRAIQFPRV